MTDKIANPHDAFAKKYLSYPHVAADFLRQHLPAEVVELLELSQLQLAKDSFIDETLRSQFSDLIYQVPTVEGEMASVYLLIDHKSYPDKWVNFQVFKYIERNWEKELAEQGKISPVISMVVYHGTQKWPGEVRFSRLISGMEKPDSKIARLLGRYVPDFDCHLINLTTLSDEEIRGEVTT